jgi:hypothetical protein
VPQRLTAIDLEILKLLWTDLYSGNGFGLTRKKLLASIQEKTPKDQAPIVKTDSALRVHLRKLISHIPPLMVSGKAETDTPGGKPSVYKFARDAAITWPTTAFILLQLWQFPGRAVEREVFIEKMLKLGVGNSSTGNRLTEDELRYQIATSIKWNYIDLVNNSVLVPTDRVEFEHALLEFIASHLN